MSPRNHHARGGALFALLALVAASVFAGVGISTAETFDVSNTNDSGTGSLREAIADAAASAGPDDVVVAPGLGTITLASTIDYGVGALGDVTIRGNGVTIEDGFGGNTISNASANTLTIEDAIITRAAPAGDIVNSGDGPMTLRRVTTTNGGPNVRDGALSIIDSSISGDTGDGVNSRNGTIMIQRSTIFGHGGDGVNTSGGDVTVVNSTITGNEDNAVNGAGGNPGDSLTAVYATFTGNNTDGSSDGTIDVETLTSYGSVYVQPPGQPNCETVPTVNSNGYNFADDSSCGFSGPGDVEDGGDPGLGPLGDNGGPTATQLPQQSSPLIDAIPGAACDASYTVDQRSLPRPADGDQDGTTDCDVGAVEVQPPPAPPVPQPSEPSGPVAATPAFTG